MTYASSPVTKGSVWLSINTTLIKLSFNDLDDSFFDVEYLHHMLSLRVPDSVKSLFKVHKVGSPADVEHASLSGIKS